MSKIIIVGGVAGGATAAARLRRLNEQDEIIMFERDEYISFANCGLPYYIGGVIENRENLLVQTVGGMSQRFNLDIRNLTEVIKINREQSTVTVKHLPTGKIYDERFDKLILSPGAKPIKPAIKGAEEADNIFVLRNIPDTDKIKNYVTDKKPQSAVVIGGGFIGVEMAENLAELGVKVTIVEKTNQVFRSLDFEMAQIVHQELNAHGVNLILGDGVSMFKDCGRKVILESGIILDADMIIMSIGVAPENALAVSANIQIGKRGHISTNKQFQVLDSETKEAISNIYAVGDAIEVTDFVNGSITAIPLAWPANRQGRLVADHINGIAIESSGIQGTAVAKVFNLAVASTGNNETQLKAKGIAYQAVHAHRANHASYYPNSTNIALKMVFDPKTGRILGAQAIGQEGTEKRIDVIATVMKLNGTIRDLPDLELSYAPPFSSAKDPVNILGYIASNVADGSYRMAQWYEIDEIVRKGGYLLDVRTPIEFSSGHIDGAVNIELDQLRNRINEIAVPKDTPIYVNCQIGLRGYIAIKILQANGFTNLFNLSGGYFTYKAGKYQVNKAVANKSVKESNVDDANNVLKTVTEVNACGLQCPGPLMATYKALNEVTDGERIRVISTDYSFTNDIENWCKSNNHTLVSLSNEKNKYIALIEKGMGTVPSCKEDLQPNTQDNASIIVFSGELDKALAAMIIAQGAAAQGKKVTLFFTFWGLNALRKNEKVKVEKNFIEKMLGFMMPKGAGKLPLSSMNLLGVGPAMIKSIMKNKNVDDVETMIQATRDVGVRFIACTMSMDLMGIKPEELIDGIEYAGVATYISNNENVGTTLFV
ncbi:MAG: DsrE/DsrF/DrsH-like family protein [Syntrophomonas sp.]